MPAWRWNILPALVAAAFSRRPDEPLPVWASKNVFLDRRMTTRPGYYDPDEYPWTWEFQEIIRNRRAWEAEMPDGAVIIVDGPEDPRAQIAKSVQGMRVYQLDVMKATQGGFTEAALNGVRYCAKHDPQNVIFAIDNRVQAGEVNEVRLQPTLRRLGEEIFTSDDDDAGKFLLKLRRMLIYFLGSYSAGAFAQKMCELGINDELEEHGTPNSVEDLESRMQSSERRLLVNLSKPKKLTRDEDGKITGGPIALEHSQGSQHVAEVPCPRCSEAARVKFRGGVEADASALHATADPAHETHAAGASGNANSHGLTGEAGPNVEQELCRRPAGGPSNSGSSAPPSEILAGYQQLLQENLKFSHCRDLTGEWDFKRVLDETYFECIHCHKPIEERWKRWMNDRTRRRWRRTNFDSAEPNHISFHYSDFYSFDESVRWGRLAINWIQSKGNPEKRASYRTHHEGLPVEVRETRTEVETLLLLRGPYKRGTIPWMPRAIILAADVGLEYVKWGVCAFRDSKENGEGECAVIDWGKDLHPDDIARRMISLRYPCLETGKQLGISIGAMDAKYRKIEVHKACLRVPRRLFPSAGIRAGLTMRSISFNKPPQRPAWFGVIVYNDDDAKSELYLDRIDAWARWLRPHEQNADEQKPFTGRLSFPEDIRTNALYGARQTGDKRDSLLDELTRENLIELPNGRLEWKRKGANEGGDILKVCCVEWRFFTLLEAGEIGASIPTPEQQAANEIAAAIATE